MISIPWQSLCRRPARATTKPYSLLFLGHSPWNGTPLLEDSIDCWQQITIALDTALNGLEHVDYNFRSGQPADFTLFYAGLPRVNAILFWRVPQIWQRYKRRQLRQATGCRAIITVCESALNKDSDWRFSFSDEGTLTTRIDGPVWKALYSQCTKCPKTVLIDHWAGGGRYDWTYKIEAWLQNVAEEFCISRYVQDENDREEPERLTKIPPFFKQIHRMPFMQWLAETDRLETFVMTHSESYGYAMLDMFARGVRVLCPTPLLPVHFRDRFHVDTFNSQDELIGLLRKPPDPLTLRENMAGLIDWSDVVRLIDDRFRRLLGLF